MLYRCLTLFALILVLLTGVACGRDRSQKTVPEPTATATPTDTPVAVQPAEDGGDTESSNAGSVEDGAMSAPQLQANALEQLSSYRSHITWSVAQNGNTVQQAELEIAEIRDPPARRMNITSDQGNFAMVQKDGQLWVEVNGQWQQIPAIGAEAMTGGQFMLTPEDLSATAAAGSGYEYIGTETVNGVKTNHYRLNVDPASLPQAVSAGQVQNVDAHIWVASQPDLPSFAVRMTIEYAGTYQGEGEASFP